MSFPILEALNRLDSIKPVLFITLRIFLSFSEVQNNDTRNVIKVSISDEDCDVQVVQPEQPDEGGEDENADTIT